MAITSKTHSDNSFDLLRLLASIAVLLSHQCILLGHPEPMLFGAKTLGFFGVAIFFILSGWLIALSWERQPDVKMYLIKRVRRIFPALWCAIFLTIFGLGVAFTNLSIKEYFTQSETWLYSLNSVLWIHHTLPGVFKNNPLPASVNGSLWTLPVEFLLYLSVMLAGLMGLLRHRAFIFLGLLTSAILPGLAQFINSPNLSTALECFFIFWWGVTLGISKRERARVKHGAIFVLIASLVLLTLFLKDSGLAYVIITAFLLVYIAEKSNFGSVITKKIGDLSYGIYIFAFPVQQMIINYFGSTRFSFLSYFLISLFFTTVIAVASWHLIEKRMIRSRYVSS